MATIDEKPEAGCARPPVLQMTGIGKSFAGVQALKDVDLTLDGGEVHALLGENGAGKSTLMKIMFGVEQSDTGAMEMDFLGRIRIDNPRHALSLGIGLVSQELSLVPQLDVAQNIFLGQTRTGGVVPKSDHRRQARQILDTLAPHVRVDALVSSLGMADRQLVEISRTLARGGRIIAFDEPTSSLTPAERDNLFAVIARLKEDGKAIVYISHRMDEIRAVADRVTVLRDGAVVASGPIGGFSTDALNTLITGRQLEKQLSKSSNSAVDMSDSPLLELKNVSTERIRDITLDLRPGEILGLAGLVGSGRSAILRAVFGVDALTAGEIRVGGKSRVIGSPAEAMKAGIALIPEDRRGSAIVPMTDIERNFGLGNHRRLSRFGFIRGAERRSEIRRLMKELDIRPPAIETVMRNLSGGNQQKVVIARWLATGVTVFLFDEPTRGIDVGGKTEIHTLVRNLAADGAAIMVVSSELPEVLMLSHRIAVVNGGRLTRIVENTAAITEEKLMMLAAAEENA